MTFAVEVTRTLASRQPDVSSDDLFVVSPSSWVPTLRAYAEQVVTLGEAAKGVGHLLETGERWSLLLAFYPTEESKKALAALGERAERRVLVVRAEPRYPQLLDAPWVPCRRLEVAVPLQDR